MIYPKLSPDGRNIAGGNKEIQINNMLAIPLLGDTKAYGTSPNWADKSTIYYTYSRTNLDGSKHKLDGMLIKLTYPFTSPAELEGEESGNVLTAGGSKWATWRPDVGVRIQGEKETHLNWHSPALSDRGILAHGINGDGTANYAWGSSSIAREHFNDIELYVDINNPLSSWQVISPEPKCGKPIPVWTGIELLVLFHTNDGCVFLMSVGTTQGYIIKPRGWDGGSGYSHDARPLSETMVRVVSPGFDEIIDLTAPRESFPFIGQVPVPPKPPKPPIPPISNEESMELPSEVQDIIFDMVGSFPLPLGEDNIRKWTIRVAEQVAFDIPDKNWGTKRADSGRPVSKDTISFNLGNGKIRIWDLVTGAGTNNPELTYNKAQSEDVNGQIFIGSGDALDDGKVFTPTNHLGDGIPNEPNPGPGPTPIPPANQQANIGHEEAVQLTQRLERKYSAAIISGGLERQLIENHVDESGHSHWRRIYFTYRDRGDSPDIAWSKVNREINRIVGLSEDIDPNT